MSTSSSYNNNDRSKAHEAISGKRAAATAVPTGAKASSANVPPEPPIDRAELDPISFQRNAMTPDVLDPARGAARRAAGTKYL